MFRLRAGDFVRERRTRQESGARAAKLYCMKESFVYTVNGLQVQAEFDTRDRERIFLPLLRKLTELQREKGRRIAAFLAAPPAAGKSTLCVYLEQLSREDPSLTPVQTAGIDGFHYTREYLNSHMFRGEPLTRIKGAPETYDVEKLKRLLELLNEPDQRWPVYDRRIHDPVEGAMEITGDILIVEGNWLLLDEKPWNGLTCDYSVFLRAGDASQLERIVARKVQGGYPEAEAREFVARNDWPNIQRCMEHSRRANLNLARAADGALEVV